MTATHKPVWVIVEQTGDVIAAVSFQLIGKARKLADQMSVPVEAILLGNDTAGLPRQLIAAGADRVYLCDAPELRQYQSELFTQIIAELAVKNQPDIMLLGSTPMGRELAPLVAGRLKTGLTADATPNSTVNRASARPDDRRVFRSVPSPPSLHASSIIAHRSRTSDQTT